MSNLPPARSRARSAQQAVRKARLHKTGFAGADLRDHRLKTVAISAGPPRLAKVVVDDMNPLAWPTEQGRSLDQPILQLSAFLVIADQPQRWLPNTGSRDANPSDSRRT